MVKSKPFITVVVPGLNEEKNIEECLKSLRNQSLKNVEIIYVDGGSSDSTVEIAKKFADKVFVEKKGKGPASARNYGAKHASADFVAFIDADSRAKHDWLERIFWNLSHGYIGVGGYVKPRSYKLLHNFMSFLSWRAWPTFTAGFRFYQFNGSNCAFRKKEFLEIGGFDEKMSFMEDVDLAMRMKKKGRLRFDSEAIVYSSVRRVEQKGYLMNFCTYLVAWFRYLLGLPITSEYFRKIRH